MSSKQPDSKVKKDDDDFFKDEFNDLDLDKEFNSKNPQKDNPFSGSITKELLQESKKEIEKDELKKASDKAAAEKGTKKSGLQIEIDENADIAEQDGQAQ